MEHGSWGLGGAFLPQSIQGMGDIFFPLKVRKDSPLEDVIHKKKNGGLEMGFKKMSLLQRWLRTQRSEKILREMDEIKYRSLKK